MRTSILALVASALLATAGVSANAATDQAGEQMAQAQRVNARICADLNKRPDTQRRIAQNLTEAFANKGYVGPKYHMVRVDNIRATTADAPLHSLSCNFDITTEVGFAWTFSFTFNTPEHQGWLFDGEH